MAVRPLQNRVDPYGALVATPARGALMGNRGGRIHLPDQTLGRRRWASRQWIACLCAFKDRRRAVWSASYTELFFLDEVTALAAGHRPCFECRRAAAESFRAHFGGRNHLSAPEIDAVLHGERLRGRERRVWRSAANDLPDGAMIALAGRPMAVRAGSLLPWSFAGYGAAQSMPGEVLVDVLTPPSTVAALSSGYRPMWA